MQNATIMLIFLFCHASVSSMCLVADGVAGLIQVRYSISTWRTVLGKENPLFKWMQEQIARDSRDIEVPQPLSKDPSTGMS